MREPCIIRHIPRPSPEVCSALADLGVATVHEAQQRTGLLSEALHPVIPGVSICGPALTVLCHAGDNLMVHAAIELIQPGDVLVVTTHTPTRCGMIGELLARAIQYRGAAGVVLDACVRDLAVLRQLRLPIWCRGVSAAGTTKEAPGWVNVPITCGGVRVDPGDLIVADDDGVVVVPHTEAAAVLEAGRVRQQREAQARARIERGELSLDYSNLREVLKQKGVRYVG